MSSQNIVPALAHAVHDELPALAYFPAAHGVQLSAPARSLRGMAEVPAGHREQLLAPAAAYMPWKHEKHLFGGAWVGRGLVPAGHVDAHEVLRWAEKVPC